MNLTPKKQTRVMLDVDMFFNVSDFNDLTGGDIEDVLRREDSFAKRKQDQISQAVDKWQYVTGHSGFALSDYMFMPNTPIEKINIKYDLELMFYTMDFPELSEHDKVDSFASRKRDQIVQAVTKWQYVTGHTSFSISVVGGIVQHQNSDCTEFYISDEQVVDMKPVNIAESVPVDVIKEAFSTNDADDSNV